MLIVGLTGGIASGKSIASKTLSRLDVPVIDADQIARELVEPHRAAYKEIVGYFGKEVLSPDKTINRRKLAKTIFSNSRKREKLNTILHPGMIEETKRRIEYFKGKGKGMVIVEAALLIEAGQLSLVDRLMVVTVRPEIQIRRLIRRDHLTEEEARERIAIQMPLSEKVKLADYIIDNSGSAKTTIRRTRAVYRELVSIETP